MCTPGALASQSVVPSGQLGKEQALPGTEHLFFRYEVGLATTAHLLAELVLLKQLYRPLGYTASTSAPSSPPLESAAAEVTDTTCDALWSVPGSPADLELICQSTDRSVRFPAILPLPSHS